MRRNEKIKYSLKCAILSVPIIGLGFIFREGIDENIAISNDQIINIIL
jgi:hypothetical protein